MTDPLKKHGRFSWNELMTNDVDSAKKFYSELLGWNMEAMPCEETDYTLLKEGDQDVGGIMAMPSDAAEMPPMWNAYVTVDDVDGVAAQVERLGGKLCVPPQDIPNIGRFCVLQDPQGAMLSLITYSDQ